MVKKVLGVRVDDVSEKEVLEKVSSWINESENSKLIFTPGPEFLVTAQNDEEFKRVLNSSNLNVPDGFGLHFAGIVDRVPGVDLMVALCQLAEEKKWIVGLLGGRQEVATKAAKILSQKFPNLKISFTISDDKVDQIVRHYLIDSSVALSFDILRCDILFVGLGHPKQEKFLEKLRKNSEKKLINFRVGMGVGGSFDLIAGVKKRAPVFLQKIGLEWLWRMIVDPRHLTRVFRATFAFVFYILRNQSDK